MMKLKSTLILLWIIGFFSIHTNAEITNFLIIDNCNLSTEDSLGIKSYMDGPLIKWRNNKVIVAYYYVTGKKEKIKLAKERFLAPLDSFILKGFSFDTNEYFLKRDAISDTSKWENVNKIFAVGDVHGEYFEMLKLLKNKNVIDDNLNWNWGDGHLVFTGDIFDRGNYVTECLWFIYQLEREAENAGGKVHFLLGTHELLTIHHFNGYLSNKYNYLYTRRERYYSDYYTDKYILGQWLRTKNTMITINNILFLHAGISEEFLNLNIDISTLNNKIRAYLNNPYKYRNDNEYKIIVNKNGPFWYRGFNKNEDDEYGVDQKIVDKILTFYGVTQIIFAHTEMDDILPTFENKLINIDIPFDIPELEHQGLYIDKNIFYKVYQDKPEKVRLF